MPVKQSQFDYVVIADKTLEDYGPLVVELSERGVRVGLFSTSEQALRAANGNAATLWILNVKLPDMTGGALLKLVRRRLPRATVFLVGDEYSADDELAARTAGATAYLCKPPSVAWLEAYRPQHSPAVLRQMDTPPGSAGGDASAVGVGWRLKISGSIEFVRFAAAWLPPLSPTTLKVDSTTFQPKELTMIAVINKIDRYDEYDDSAEFERFERFTYRRDGAFPVRSHTPQMRGKFRSRSTASGRRGPACSTGSTDAARASVTAKFPHSRFRANRNSHP